MYQRWFVFKPALSLLRYRYPNASFFDREMWAEIKETRTTTTSTHLVHGPSDWIFRIDFRLAHRSARKGRGRFSRDGLLAKRAVVVVVRDSRGERGGRRSHHAECHFAFYLFCVILRICLVIVCYYEEEREREREREREKKKETRNARITRIFCFYLARDDSSRQRVSFSGRF